MQLILFNFYAAFALLYTIDNKKKKRKFYILFLYICDMTTNLDNISISQYISLLKSGTDIDRLNEINGLLSAEMSETGTGMDLELFMLQKDMLLLQCKFALAELSFDKEEAIRLSKRINSLKDKIEYKTKKKETVSPYKSFLDWLLSVEKHVGFSISRDESLTYLCQATKQMLNYFESQKQAYEKNKVKR